MAVRLGEEAAEGSRVPSAKALLMLASLLLASSKGEWAAASYCKARTLQGTLWGLRYSRAPLTLGSQAGRHLRVLRWVSTVL